MRPTYTVASWQFEAEGIAPAVTFRCKYNHRTVRAANFCLTDHLNCPSRCTLAFHLAPWTRRGVVRSDGKIAIRAREIDGDDPCQAEQQGQQSQSLGDETLN